MKEKNQTFENFKLIQPFVNLLLFDSNNSLGYDNSYFEKLSVSVVGQGKDIKEN